MKKGKLRVYLGYAPSMGKTYRMLEDAHAEKEDLVLGYLAENIENSEELESLEGSTDHLDVEKILIRKPKICLIDELAFTGPRYKEVEKLLKAGIDVWTTMNFQHLASVQSKVEIITGHRMRETVPDKFLRHAKIIPIAIEPRLLQERIAKTRLDAELALENFYQTERLEAMRRLFWAYVSMNHDC